MSGIKRKHTEDLNENKQFTAASILRSAYESNTNDLKTPDFRIADLDELHYYQQRKRTEFENALRRNRFNYGQWMRYAQFEVDQKDLQRARSIFERALEVDYKNVSMWVRYIQVEVKNKNINHARNLLERATKLLPRIDKLWYLYVTIEESIGNVIAVDEIFEKWLQWKPVKDVWIHFIEFKERYEEYEAERLIFEKFVTVFSDSDSWLLWTEFEKNHGDYKNVVNVFKLGVNSLFSSKRLDSKFIIAWIQYEYSNKKYDKIRELYKFGFKALPSNDIRSLQQFQTDFEKQYGVDSGNIENYILVKRKNKYEEQLMQSPKDYELWWIYFTLITDSNLEIDQGGIREKFNQSISNTPLTLDAHEWLLYFYLFYRYAMWEEFTNENIEFARSLYEKFMKLIPHKNITIVEFWMKYSEFELRNFGLTAMRKILGQAIGLSSNEDIIKKYIDLEIKLKYFDRARKLYNKLVELYPDNWENWLDYFNFEDSLGNDIRSFTIVEISIFEDFLDKQGKLNFIESVLDKLVENYNFKLARRLLEYTIQLSGETADSMIQRCLFELKVPTERQIKEFESGDDANESNENKESFTFEIDEESKEKVRVEYERFLDDLKNKGDVENRIIVLESFKQFEVKYGNAERVLAIEERLPNIRRKVRSDESNNQEEYIEYVFPEDEKAIENQVNDFKSKFFADLDGDFDNEDENDDDKEDADGDEENFGEKSFKSRFASDSEEEAEVNDETD